MYDVVDDDQIRRYRYGKEDPSSLVVCVLRAEFQKNMKKPWKAAGHESRSDAHYFSLELREQQDYPALDDNACCSHDALAQSFAVGQVPGDGDCIFTCIRRLFAPLGPGQRTRATRLPVLPRLPTALEVRWAIADAVTRAFGDRSAREVSGRSTNPRRHALCIIRFAVNLCVRKSFYF